MSKIEKTSFENWKDMENAHREGNLIKVCEKCGGLYKPNLRFYYKNKLNPELLKVEKIKIPVGNWFLSRYCNFCIKNIDSNRKLKRSKK